MTAPNIKHNIDWKKADDLLMAGCTIVEIASYFGCCRDTIYKRFESEFGYTLTTHAQQKREKGDTLLRAKQYEKAIKGDNTLLIWLGKNRLKQKDKEVTEEVDHITLLRECLAEIKRNSPGLPGNSRPELAVKSSLLDQGQPGEEGQIQSELGTAGISE